MLEAWWPDHLVSKNKLSNLILCKLQWSQGPKAFKRKKVPLVYLTVQVLRMGGEVSAQALCRCRGFLSTCKRLATLLSSMYQARTNLLH